MNWEELIFNISTGSIFEVKAKDKDYKSKNIRLDFYGFDAVLPLKEISNNYELAFSLFNIVKKGEIITLVLINIDESNRKLTFSTKIFRNALDDILPFWHCSQIVNENFRKRRYLPENFLLEQRNTLERLRGDLSSNELTFLYELIQNAVDHPNRNFNNDVSITFEVLGNHLLVKHNGALFTENNFESITGILYGEQIQEGDKTRIGYKGIGFKSVFQFTDNAYIRSGNFSFRFSKKETGGDKPWEVLPLFQIEKDMVEKIRQFEFFNAPVAFAFEFNSEQNRIFVIKSLQKLSKNPYLLIFLENLIQLKIVAPSLIFTENETKFSFSALDVTFNKELAKTEKIDSIKLYANNSYHSGWLIFRKNDLIITNKEVIKELTDESNPSIPPKMRQFRSPRITIALPIQSLKPDMINLFAYLPLSNTKYKLPFLVNADFIPNLDRTDIIHNLKYNYEILNFVVQTYKEFAIELIENKKLEYLNALIPNLTIEYRDFPNNIVKDILNILPEISLAYNEEKIQLKRIAIDKTSFAANFGLKTFKELIDRNNVPIDNISEYKNLINLITKVNPESVFDYNILRNKITSDDFKYWLKDPLNNLNFLKYLYNNEQLELFKDESIFLSVDETLNTGAEIYINLGQDSQLLEWLSFKNRLHSKTYSGLSEIPLPLKQYNPISFINEIICKQQKPKIVEGLNNRTISFDHFYIYISKYANDPLFPAREIQNFPLRTKQGILESWTKPIYFAATSLDLLLSRKSIPDGLFYTLDEEWSHTLEAGLKILALKLGVISFKDSEPYSYISTIISTNKAQILNFYQTQEKICVQNNAELWRFLMNSFDNLSPNQLDELKNTIKLFPILSKKGKYKALHTLYISSAYTDNDALESLSDQFHNTDIDFVNAEYLDYLGGDKSRIKKFFKRLDAKEETADFLLHTLLPNLNQIGKDLYVALTRIIYENRDSEQIINAIVRNNQFKLKTKEGNLKPINECYIGSPYIDETQIPNPLSLVPVVNQISNEYANSHLDAWQRFFSEKLKVIELRNETEILGIKLKHIADNLELWKNAKDSVSLLKDIYSLYKLGKLSLTSTNLSYIKRIPLLCKGDETNFSLSNNIHFSSTFKPTFDFEKIFGIECDVPFLSDLYKFDDDNQLISFFEQLGVTQYFDKNRHSTICQSIPTADGLKKPASQLYKYDLKKYVGQSNVAFENLSKYEYNGRTLEDYLGFKSKLDVAAILNYITEKQPNRRELKDLISELLKVFNSYNDRNQINTFITSGKLLSTAKAYNHVGRLHSIDESIRSGIRENVYLIDPLFYKQEQIKEHYFKLFNIKNLTINDFNPHYDNVTADFEFTKRVNDRLLFLAFDSDSEKYFDIENEFKIKFQAWRIQKCSKISLKYLNNECIIIKEDSKTFEILNEKLFYYIGSWTDPRVNPELIDCLIKNILGLNKQRSFIQDLLLNDPIEIIEDFENKGRTVPEEIKQRFPIAKPAHPTIDSKPIKTIRDLIPDITEDDEAYIRGIISLSYDKEGQIDANTTAKIKTLMAIRDQYSTFEKSDEGRFLKAGSDEIIVRSAQNGLLYLDVYHWGRLSEPNVRLSVYTKNQIEIFDTQENLINYTKPQNKFGIVRMPNKYDVDDYNSLDNITNKGEWHYVFIVNENTKAVQNYKEVMNLDDYNF